MPENKRMTDAELTAAAALLNAKRLCCESENRLRELQGDAPAYADVDAQLELAIENELKARGVL